MEGANGFERGPSRNDMDVRTNNRDDVAGILYLSGYRCLIRDHILPQIDFTFPSPNPNELCPSVTGLEESYLRYGCLKTVCKKGNPFAVMACCRKLNSIGVDTLIHKRVGSL